MAELGLRRDSASIAGVPTARSFPVFLLFLPMAAVGTLLHEAGHLTVAAALGYETELHYGSVTWWDPGGSEPAAHAFYITLAGPLQTILFGTVGLGLLFRRRREAALGARGWAALLLALFWSRQVFNAGKILLGYVRGGEWARGGGWPATDEVELAEYLGWPALSLAFGSAALGLAVCSWVVFGLVPRASRRAVLLGGGLGSLAGFAIWYGVLGPRLLP